MGNNPVVIEEIKSMLVKCANNLTTSVPAIGRAKAELFLVLILIFLRGCCLFRALVVFLVLEAVDVESGAFRQRPLLFRCDLLAVVVLLAGALDAGDDRLVRLDEVARPAR